MKGFIEVHIQGTGTAQLIAISAIKMIESDAIYIKGEKPYSALCYVESYDQIKKLIEDAEKDPVKEQKKRSIPEESSLEELLSYIDDALMGCTEAASSQKDTKERAYFYGKKFAYDDIRRRLTDNNG